MVLLEIKQAVIVAMGLSGNNAYSSLDTTQELLNIMDQLGQNAGR